MEPYTAFERLLFSRIEAWVLIAVLLVGTLFTIMFGGAILYKSEGGKRGGEIGDLLLSVARIPDTLIQISLSEKKFWIALSPNASNFFLEK